MSLFALSGQRPRVEEGAASLTTVQQRGQNHQRSARARSRNRIRRAIARMEPSDCGAEREGGQQWDWLCVQPAQSLGGARQHLWSPHPTLPSSVCRFKAWRRAQLAKQMAETLCSILGNTPFKNPGPAEAGPCQKRASSRFEAGTSGLLSLLCFNRGQ